MINKKFLMSLAVAGVLLFASNSNAQAALEDADVFYAKVAYNATKMQKVEWTKCHAKGALKFKPDYENSFIGGSAALGYYFGGMRVELEGSIHNVEPTKDFAVIPKETDPKEAAAADVKYGGISSMGGMLSVNYDLALSDYISPYLGVGFGLHRVSLKLGDSDTLSTAYHMSSQLRGGVSITGLAAVVPYAGYKFTYMNEREYTKVSVNSVEMAPKLSHMVHNFEAGLMLPINA